MVRLVSSVLGMAIPLLLALFQGSEQAGHGRVAYEGSHAVGHAALDGPRAVQHVVSVVVFGSEHSTTR